VNGPQVHRFGTGGHAVHALTVRGRKYSVWLDEGGRFIDAEWVRADGRTFGVRSLDTTLIEEIRAAALAAIRAYEGKP